MDVIKERVVNNFNRLLEERGLSRQGLCRETGLSYGTLRRALGERDDGMSTQSIVKLSEALGVDPSVLTSPERYPGGVNSCSQCMCTLWFTR